MMRFLVLYIFIVSSLTAALPSLSSSANAENKPEQRDSTFIVHVQPAQPEMKAREFPWPYPPIFESVLPEEVKERLRLIYANPALTSKERFDQTNAVFDELPQEVVERLPLPQQYERLPADVYRRIFYIHVAPGFKWNERQQLIRNIVESLPEDQKQLMMTPGIGGPPPGFEFVLTPTIYKQLLMVHHNPLLTKEEKANLITHIMHQVPQDQINRLPLPAGMNQLPMEAQRRLHALVYDYSVPQSLRAQRVNDFVLQLPVEMRP